MFLTNRQQYSRHRKLPSSKPRGKHTLESLESRQLLTTYAGTGGAIADNTTTDFALNVADSVQIGDLDVQLNIQHSRDADLDVFLVSPDGTRVELFTDVGGGGDDFSATVLDDEAGTAITSGSAPFAGTYRPEGSLGDFNGKDAAGTWTLEVTDDRRRQSGELIDWSVTIEPVGPPTISISDTAVTEGQDALRSLDTFVSDGSGGISTPRNLIFGPDGNLYVGSVDTGEILRYDGETGAFLDAFVTGGGNLQEPGGLQFNPADGDLYVADVAGNQVHRFDGQSGAYVDSPVSGLARPLGITFDDSGNLLIANRDSDEVLIYDGTTLNPFVTAGSGGLDEPRNAVFGPDGMLYVSSEHTQEILRYDGTSGAFVDVFATTPLGINSPNWIEFGNDGVLYASSRTVDACCDRSIIRFDAATGDLIDTYDKGVDGWSFTIGPDSLVYNAGNSFGNVVSRVGPESIATFTVSLSVASDTEVTVDYSTTGGTATTGTDFMQASGTIVFSPGETSRTILVPTVDDDVTESPEAFVVNLSNPSGASLADAQAEATIFDDDAPATQKFIYVYDIGFDSKRGGKDWRAVFSIRDQDSSPIAGVQIEVTFAGNTYSGTTDSNGIFRTTWIRNLSSANHYAEAVDLAFAGHDWDQDLGWSEDYDSDGLPDALLVN